jgi:hypothetical protein
MWKSCDRLVFYTSGTACRSGHVAIELAHVESNKVRAMAEAKESNSVAVPHNPARAVDSHSSLCHLETSEQARNKTSKLVEASQT